MTFVSVLLKVKTPPVWERSLLAHVGIEKKKTFKFAVTSPRQKKPPNKSAPPRARGASPPPLFSGDAGGGEGGGLQTRGKRKKSVQVTVVGKNNRSDWRFFLSLPRWGETKGGGVGEEKTTTPAIRVKRKS